MSKIITTVGTSIYTNLLKKEVFDLFEEEKYVIITNEQYDDLKELKAEAYSESLFKDYEESLFEHWVQNILFNNGDWLFVDNKINTNCCAEIKTLTQIGYIKEYDHLLISTDTAISYSSARIIRRILTDIFEINEKRIKIEIIPDLQIYDAEKFKNDGINNLVDIIKKNSEDSILNISGGYKALIPILTIIAQLEDIPIKYVYEESSELIEIGHFPINFDYFIAETYHYYLENYKKVKNILSDNEKTKLKKFLLIADDGKITVLGNFFLEYLKNVDFSRDTLGHYYEYKFFYHLFKNKQASLKNFSVYEIGFSFNLSTQEKGEIDIVLKNNNDEYCFIEVKSFIKSGKSKTLEQIDKYNKYAQENNINLKKIILYIYKFDFQNLKTKQNIYRQMKSLCNSYNVEFEILFSEIPISQNDLVNYKYIFENDLKIEPFDEF